jgi:hypothetical protein
VEASELIAADLFKAADEHRRRITFADVERCLAQSASHPRGCACGRCPLVSQASAQRIFYIASGWLARNQGHQGACAALRAALSRSRGVHEMEHPFVTVVGDQPEVLQGVSGMLVG